ncbi:hypothetical protein NPS38_26975 [Pseudomonas putida]|uniref:Alpha/beta hydrolase fold-3 domain-containing protein n=1 Tax=Achromobacter insolitus TaxID=217204 RepID=A0A6S7FGZ5_9BURK|nr:MULTISPECIES: hypothetical protein [Pseudomonadota]MDD2012817.1 hypothetical protein [Pseudomonas putida]CAB3939998.1 hypothetical protein LMG6000_06362 [Achromobacter insolitus]CAB3948916.1 hypothetical protein LMG5997_06532 [Achromobacter insolitus]
MKLYREFTTQEEIDLQCDCEAPQDMRAIWEWVTSHSKLAHSKLARSELDCYLDERFGPTVDETVDIFPSSRTGSPLVVFIHGGWWSSTTSKEWSLMARGLVPHGVTVAVTNYTCAPRHRSMKSSDRAALPWLGCTVTRSATTLIQTEFTSPAIPQAAIKSA